MGWGAGMLNAVRTKTVVVYCQLYLPVVLVMLLCATGAERSGAEF